MAAHLEGKSTSIFDMTGLSQKNGAVFSHVRIAAFNDDLGAQKLGVGEADLALAFDAVAGLAKEAAMTLSRDGTKLVVNARITPTPAFQRNPDLKLDQRSEEHTSELQSLMRISYAVFCLKTQIYTKTKAYTK